MAREQPMALLHYRLYREMCSDQVRSASPSPTTFHSPHPTLALPRAITGTRSMEDEEDDQAGDAFNYTQHRRHGLITPNYGRCQLGRCLGAPS